MLRGVLLVIHVAVCVGLVVAVLLQTGRSAGLGAIGGGMEALFGKKRKGIDVLLGKIAVTLAVLFFCTSVILNVV
ncbi:MAG: preprotein translocase subunit SecG [Firmicutes bacterium]|nr:preprotein translocase subunit SecG [Bacillota bacterium]